jgi:hypothetical protein
VKRDEAQLTQFIAGAASTEREFASALARVLVDNAPAPRNFSPPIDGIFEMPGELVCRPEQRVWDLAASSKGFVDLLFRTADRQFVLLAELKLHSGYGREHVQVPRNTVARV